MKKLLIVSLFSTVIIFSACSDIGGTADFDDIVDPTEYFEKCESYAECRANYCTSFSISDPDEDKVCTDACTFEGNGYNSFQPGECPTYDDIGGENTFCQKGGCCYIEEVNESEDRYSGKCKPM